MFDTRGLGIEYSRAQLEEFEKVADLFLNENREIYAELRRDSDNRIVYFREWLSNHGIGDSYNFCIINSLDELKVELKKDVDHGDLAPGKVLKICNDTSYIWEND